MKDLYSSTNRDAGIRRDAGICSKHNGPLASDVQKCLAWPALYTCLHQRAFPSSAGAIPCKAGQARGAYTVDLHSHHADQRHGLSHICYNGFRSYHREGSLCIGYRAGVVEMLHPSGKPSRSGSTAKSLSHQTNPKRGTSCACYMFRHVIARMTERCGFDELQSTLFGLQDIAVRWDCHKLTDASSIFCQWVKKNSFTASRLKF